MSDFELLYKKFNDAAYLIQKTQGAKWDYDHQIKVTRHIQEKLEGRINAYIDQKFAKETSSASGFQEFFSRVLNYF